MRPFRTFGVLCLLVLAGDHAWAFEGRVVLKEGARPAVDAEVSVLGRPGHVLTDGDGRFRLVPSPRAPFEVLVVLPGGRYTRPVRFETLPEGTLTVEVEAILEESVTVTAGSAPSIEGTPASGITLLQARELEGRLPVNLAQALENVAGTSTVSEGQAAAPAVRGLSGGRTLILIDGARVTAERRVGPSATYVDPVVLEAVEVARGPGALAYGSDAFGGVIQMRTRRPSRAGPWGARFEGSLGAGAPQQRASLLFTRGFSRGGVLVEGHYRNFDDWESPEGRGPNSGARDQGFLVRFDHVLGGGLFSAGLAERLRARHRAPTQQLTDGALLLPRGELAPPEPGLGTRRRGEPQQGGRERLRGELFARHGPGPLRHRHDPAQHRARGRLGQRLPPSRLRAEADRQRPPGSGPRPERPRRPRGARGAGALRRRRADRRRAPTSSPSRTRGASTRACTRASRLLWGERSRSRAACEATSCRAATRAAISAIARPTTAPSRGSPPPPWGRSAASRRRSRWRAGSATPSSPTATSADPPAAASSPAIPTSIRRRACSSTWPLRYSAGGFRAAAYAYEYRIEDLIERYQTETDFFFFRNRGEARVRGIEAEAQVELPERFALEVTAHLLDGEALDDGTGLDGIPPPTLTLRLRRGFGRASGWVRVAAYDRLDDPGPTEQARAGYALLDAGADVRLGTKAEIRVLGRNLLDKAYLVSPDSRAVLAPGITGIATLSLRF